VILLSVGCASNAVLVMKVIDEVPEFPTSVLEV